jgi:amino-acid N-acetyltransferase
MSEKVSTALKIAVSQTERQQVMDLLQQQKLPVSDIKEETLLYKLTEDGKLIGTAGLDIFDDCALLRSVSVSGEIRGKGYGKILNDKIEQLAKDNGVNCMYLITHTAKDFFDRQGYTVIDRTTAPDAIKQTDQFTGLCPSSAVVMKKYI